MWIKHAWNVLWNGLPASAAPEQVRVEVVKQIPYDVTRHQLGSINLKDLKDAREWTEAEKKQHNADLGVVVSKKAFKIEVDNLREAQAYFCAEQAQDNRQLDFARGTINGITLVMERLEQLAGKHYQDTKPKEDYDVHAVLPSTPISAAAMDRA